MSKNMKSTVSWKMFLRTLLTVGFPVAMQNLLGTTASMVDTIMIGSCGEQAVAAVGICSQIGSLFFSLYWGFSAGAMLFFAQYWGAQDEDGINRTFGGSLVFMTVIGVVFGALCVVDPHFLLRVYTDKEDIIALAVPYMRIVGYAYPLQCVGALMSFLLRSTERVRVPLISSILSLLVNFVLNFTLIYGRFGFPAMGAAGAAVGTLVSGGVNLCILAGFLLKDNRKFELKITKMFRFNGAFMKSYLSKCFPILCNEMLYGVGQMIINIVMGHQDESAIAAMAAFRVCEGFVFAFFGGLCNAMSLSVGTEVGAGRLQNGYSFAKKAIVACPLCTFTIVLVMEILYRPLFSVFGLGEQAVYYGKYMLLIYLFFGSVRTCDYIMNEAFRAGGEAVFGTVLEISCLFIFSVPATWLTGMVLRLPFLFVFGFVYTDELIRLVVEGIYIRSGKWVKPVTEEGRAALAEFRRMLRGEN